MAAGEDLHFEGAPCLRAPSRQIVQADHRIIQAAHGNDRNVERRFVTIAVALIYLDISSKRRQIEVQKLFVLQDHLGNALVAAPNSVQEFLIRQVMHWRHSQRQVGRTTCDSDKEGRLERNSAAPQLA